MILPFLPGHTWAYTGGPHGAWEHEGAYAAVDFAPAGDAVGCVQSDEWVTAAADGLVVYADHGLVTRSDDGLVVIDLDGDGREQTG